MMSWTGSPHSGQGAGFVVVRLVVVVVPVFVVVGFVVRHVFGITRPAVTTWCVQIGVAWAGRRYALFSGENRGRNEHKSDYRTLGTGAGDSAIAALLASSFGRGHLGRGRSSALVWSDPGRSVFGQRSINFGATGDAPNARGKKAVRRCCIRSASRPYQIRCPPAFRSTNSAVGILAAAYSAWQNGAAGSCRIVQQQRRTSNLARRQNIFADPGRHVVAVTGPLMTEFGQAIVNGFGKLPSAGISSVLVETACRSGRASNARSMEIPTETASERIDRTTSATPYGENIGRAMDADFGAHRRRPSDGLAHIEAMTAAVRSG